tara:strand:- start:773 stop:1078 length:306 start_codon:yes stop_codon:yes gene_type:complete
MAKEKEIELKVKAEKISKEHLEELQTLVNKINTIQFNIGKIEAQKHSTLHELAITQERIPMLQDKLTREYGSYDVDLKDGTINWPKEPSENGVDKPNKDEK